MNAPALVAAPSLDLRARMSALGAVVRPPLEQPRFWLVQLLVLAVAVGHYGVESVAGMDLHDLEFIPVTLHVVPVMYAAVTFGTRGAVLTGLWCFALTIPNVIVFHAGAGEFAEVWQAGLVVTVGIFVGHRVDEERRARSEADSRERHRRASDARYRGLFEAAPDPILVLDEAGNVLDFNAAAAGFCTPAIGKGAANLAEIHPGLWRAISTGRKPEGSPAPIPFERAGGTTWIEPIGVRFGDADGEPRLLAQFHDVTPTVERQRLVDDFARRTVSAREEERRRVARDLHDGPVQSLILLWRALDPAGAAGSRDIHGTMAGARERVEEVASELRRFSRDLRPSILDDLGLDAALKAEAEAVGARSNIAVQYTSSGASRRLDSEVEVTLLRICQEALRNVERHARAVRVLVSFEVGPDSYRLLVADDGIGLTSLPRPKDLVANGRLGVVGMQERARLIGAECSLISLPGWSTAFEVIGSASEGGHAGRGEPASGHPTT